ncbi:MAG: 4Fe-4S dicluster domain-containing protein, partial [Muribaculaceae bacterium]
TELGWRNMLHPVLDYDRSYCLYDCTQCTDACSSGALMPLTVEEKHIFIIGRAMVAEPACIGCGQCERACPRDAVEMVPRAGGRGRKARVKTELCIGCGACHHVCPARPDKAIWVEGIV